MYVIWNESQDGAPLPLPFDCRVLHPHPQGAFPARSPQPQGPLRHEHLRTTGAAPLPAAHMGLSTEAAHLAPTAPRGDSWARRFISFPTAEWKPLIAAILVSAKPKPTCDPCQPCHLYRQKRHPRQRSKPGEWARHFKCSVYKISMQSP